MVRVVNHRCLLLYQLSVIGLRVYAIYTFTIGVSRTTAKNCWKIMSSRNTLASITYSVLNIHPLIEISGRVCSLEIKERHPVRQSERFITEDDGRRTSCRLGGNFGLDGFDKRPQTMGNRNSDGSSVVL